MTEQIYNLAFVFPGQGSQSVGMMNDLAEQFPEIKQIFERASDALSFNLWELVTNGSEIELNQTHNTQPAMLAAGFSIWHAWCKNSNLRPAWFAGHSLGEYTALVCAEVMSFEDALKLVTFRGHLMQEAVPAGVGAMAAILGLEDHEVVKICLNAAENEIVSAVNFNSTGQVVIAGHATAVERAIVLAKTAGAKRAILLPVSVPSHCELMRPAAEKLADYLQSVTIETPKTTIIHNVDVASHNAPEVIRNALKQQLYKPVRWVDSIKFMNDQGVTRFVECGVGKVLLGLNKRIVKNAEHFALSDANALTTTLGANKMTKKIALVTGASRGIGRAIAEKLAEDNFFVLGTATTENSAIAISNYLGENGKGLTLDVADASSIEQVMKMVIDEFGTPFVLVNNAGITRDNLLMRMKDDEWDSIINTNLTSIFRMSKAVLRGMMKAKVGRIINISSVVGSTGNVGQANYAAAKAGMVGFSKSLAKEIGSRNITVNTVAPGFIDTDMTKELSDEIKNNLLTAIPLGRLGDAKEIAYAVAFLASDNASYITGETLHVNGGMFMP